MSDPMAHLNRRSDDHDDGQRHRVLDLVEGTGAKFVARMVTPALLAALIGVLVWIGKGGMARLDRVVEDQASMKTDLRVMSLRFDEVGLAQIKSNTDRIEQGEKKDIEQDRRIDELVRTVKTP